MKTPGRSGFTLRLSAFICGFSAFVANAEPYRYDDIRLGSSLVRLAQELDFRDIHAAIAEQKERQSAKPDLGRRGYGCARREDAFADVACVSHDERVCTDGTRLQVGAVLVDEQGAEATALDDAIPAHASLTFVALTLRALTTISTISLVTAT